MHACMLDVRAMSATAHAYNPVKLVGQLVLYSEMIVLVYIDAKSPHVLASLQLFDRLTI